MRVLKQISWVKNVQPVWAATHPNQVDLNKDIWTQFPEGIVWHTGIIESRDIDRLCIIGSSDWLTLFSTFRLKALCQYFESASIAHDPRNHIERITQLQSYYEKGGQLAPLILIASEQDGPFVIVDGNHRACALQLNGCLAGQAVLLGLSSHVPSQVAFFNVSLSH